MNGNSYHFGDAVTMYGGRGNTGITKTATSDSRTSSLALQGAIQELVELTEQLRAVVSSANATTIDVSLANVTPGAAVEPEERHRALMAIAGIAATVGALGQPVLDAVNKVLALFGSR